MSEEAVVPEPKFILLKMADRPAYLIGQLMEECITDVVLYYPVLVTIYNDEDGMQVVSSKYLPFAEKDMVSIVKTAIHAVATPKPRLIQHYLEFVKRWRDDGLEKILESRMVGDKDPETPIALNGEPPGPSDVKH